MRRTSGVGSGTVRSLQCSLRSRSLQRGTSWNVQRFCLLLRTQLGGLHADGLSLPPNHVFIRCPLEGISSLW
jgi:hypothetical protein